MSPSPGENPIMTRKTKKQMPRTMRIPRPNVPVVDINHPENYLTLSMNGVTVGSSTGAVGTGSLAFNDTLMNTSTNTGTHLQLGTGTNLRLGKHVFFTRLLIRLRVSTPYSALNNNSLRVIIAKNERDSTIGNATTNTALTGLVEGVDFIEPTQQFPVGFPNQLPIDYCRSPSSDYTFIHDCLYPQGNVQTVVGTSETSYNYTIELDIPLRLPRSYDSNNVVDTGSWYIHFLGGDLTSGGYPSYIWGQMRCQYVNQNVFESLGRGIKGAVSSIDDVIQHVGKSRALQLLAHYAPIVFGL
jgi:hypothetical protein